MGSAASANPGHASPADKKVCLPSPHVSVDSTMTIPEPELQRDGASIMTIDPEDQSPTMPDCDWECMSSWRSWECHEVTRYPCHRSLRHHVIYTALLDQFQQAVELAPGDLEQTVAAHRGDMEQYARLQSCAAR